MSLPVRNPDDSNRIRLPSWDAPPPPPPRKWTGPKRYGYPPIRRSRLDELEERLAQAERVLGTVVMQLENPDVPYFLINDGEVCRACRAEPCIEHGGRS